jgi:hypothetical protein
VWLGLCRADSVIHVYVSCATHAWVAVELAGLYVGCMELDVLAKHIYKFCTPSQHVMAKHISKWHHMYSIRAKFCTKHMSK